MQTVQNQSILLERNKGKIIKGTLNDAFLKLRTSSIPSKNQNIIYNNHKSPAFGDSKERFYTSSFSTTNPGPGQYRINTQQSTSVWSKKGYGPLISQTKLDRLERISSGLPGPGAYQSQQSFKRIRNRSKSTALLSSQIQGHQLFKHQLQKSAQIPGPGFYKFNKARSISSNFITSLKSSVKRFEQKTEEIPPVGYYEINKNQGKIVSQKKQILISKISNDQIYNVSKQKLKIVQNILFNKKNLKNVGPGTYDIPDIQTKVGFKIHKTNYDRFGQVKRKQGFRSQSQQVKNQKKRNIMFEKIQKKLGKTNDYPSSMFKSHQKRQQLVNKNMMDPGRYSPQKLGKKSHLINFQQKWV